ncbi:MAG: hypothetical protein HYS57_02865 [Parcubacteria group bacterium]|nr:hypothetical protein [Parcubacteria group bacterium]
MEKEFRLTMLASGRGTTIERILQEVHNGRLRVKPVGVIVSRREAGAIEKAERFGLPWRVINPRFFGNRQDFGTALLDSLFLWKSDIVGQYGWLPLTPKEVIDRFRGKIINQHSGPLDPGRPDFGGKGMYGNRIHCARLAFVRKVRRDFWTEVTTHFVSEEFDKGAVIGRIVVPLLKEEVNSDYSLYNAALSLAARALIKEHELQVQVLERFVSGTVTTWIRADPLVHPGEETLLEEAKREAAVLFPKG